MKIRFTWKEHTIIKVNWNEIKVLENEIIDVENYKFLLSNLFVLVEEENKENILNKIDSLKSDIKNKRLELESFIQEIEIRLLKEVSEKQDKFNEYEKQKKQEIFILNWKLIEFDKEVK